MRVVPTLAVIAAIILLGWLTLKTASYNIEPIIPQEPQLNVLVRGFLASKDSPLAPETDLLLKQKHWKLLVAISAIESQYCKRQLGWNCWGIGGDSAYRHYESIRAAIVDANNLISYWQQLGRWLTVEDMDCHYVSPCNQNWVRVVNKVLNELEVYEQSVGTIHQ